MITFVTGIYGAGKTTLAKALPGRFVNYDAVHDYQAEDFDPRPFLASLEAGDVVDALPFNQSKPGLSSWAAFNEWAAGRDDVRVVAVVCAPDAWRQRVGDRADEEQWCQFMLSVFGWLDVDEWRHDGEVVSIARAARVVGLRESVKSYVTNYPSAHHDTKYQDVDAIDFRGYSDSSASWDTIKDLVDWHGQTVVDAGCFHGYFALKALSAGAAWAIGLDQSGPALAVARCVKLLDGAGRADFRHWVAGDPIPASTVLLCLNAIHHFGDAAESVMEDSRAPLAIYECGTEWETRLRQRYDVVTVHPSHRKGRAIYKCARS